MTVAKAADTTDPAAEAALAMAVRAQALCLPMDTLAVVEAIDRLAAEVRALAERLPRQDDNHKGDDR